MLLARRHQLESVFLFFASLIFFTFGLGSQEVIGFDSRFYLFAQEMRRYGISWFPMTYHHPYPDYPAASTMVIYAVAKLFGGLNKWAAVLPAAILAALTVTLTYLIGSLQNKRWGWTAAMLLLLTAAFIKSARSISLDMYSVVITVSCFYLVFSADKENKFHRVKWMYLFLFLGFAFRGPIGLVMPAGVICSYYFINQDVRKLFLHGVIAFLLLCVCTALLLALAYHVGGDAFMRDVLRMEILGRMDNHYLPRYFYFTNSFASCAPVFPLACLVLAGAIYSTHIVSSDKKFLLQLFGWMMIIMIGMSIPDDKKVRYILPMLPAAALIAAYPFVALPPQRYYMLLRTLLRRVLLVFPILLLISTIILSFYLKYPFDYFYTIVFFAVMQGINLTINTEKTILSVAALSFVIANIMIVEPIQLYIDRSHDLVTSVEAQRIRDHARLAFYREKPDGLPIKYLINMKVNDAPLFIQNEKELADFSGTAYFITSEPYYDELPKSLTDRFRMIAKEPLGHIKVIVFKKER